jgi:methionyl-tRNA formyltransferase
MSNEFHFREVLVISDNPIQCARLYRLLQELNIQKHVNFKWACSGNSNPLEFQREVKVPFQHLDLKNNEQVQSIIKSFSLVISMHCKQLFPEPLVRGTRCINVHPGYNPVNRGWYPQVFAVINELPIGATIHEIDCELDHGPIIDRMLVQQNSWDTSLDLYNRILDAEMALLQKNLIPVLKNKYEVLPAEGQGNLFLKNDFNKLCQLDLDEQSSFRNFLNRLRALSHGTFKNAFYIDKKTGRKVYVNVQFDPCDPLTTK